MQTHQPEPSSTTTTAAAACLIASMVVPELANLVESDRLAWILYHALNELAKAALCLLLAASVPRAKYGGWLGATWFTTQAADEVFNGNLFTDQQWEYPLLAILCVTITILKSK